MVLSPFGTRISHLQKQIQADAAALEFMTASTVACVACTAV